MMVTTANIEFSTSSKALNLEGKHKWSRSSEMVRGCSAGPGWMTSAVQLMLLDTEWKVRFGRRYPSWRLVGVGARSLEVAKE